LRKQTPTSDRTLGQNNLSKTSLQLCHESLRSRRWALLATSSSALLGPFLTIVVSGLFFIQTESLGLSVPFQRADDIASPSGKYCLLSNWTQASLCAASLLDGGYGFYPRGSFENLIYPLQRFDLSYTYMRGSRLFNASSVQVNVPVVMSNITCQVMDSAGFRYTLGITGTNNPPVSTLELPFQKDDWNATHLNLTHVSFASYQCEDSWLSCGNNQACPDDGTLCTGKVPSRGFDFDREKLNSFVDVLYAF
jgi:hypothetical protein